MENIIDSLNKISFRLSEDSFLGNKGLSNEVGIHIFCYNPKYEQTVIAYFDKLKSTPNTSFNLIECDLYKIFLKICEDKKVLNVIPKIEESKDKTFLITQLQNIATPEVFVNYMKYEPHKYGDVLLITGVGKVYPFMRAHNILDNIQHVFSDIPILVLYPGSFNGQEMNLFGKFHDSNYYRAFNLL